MKLSELQQALRAADSAAVLVTPRVLERVIQLEGKLPTFVWEVPHRKCYVVDRHVLFRHVEQDELNLEPDRLLPPTVILLARPAPEELNNEEPEAILLTYWRRLFHASVHLALEKKTAEGTLSPEDLRARIQQIGEAEFEEIRMVLDQDHYLLRPTDERCVYIEFAAVYLELRHFEANLLPIYFPAIGDFEGIDQMLARDVDAPALFAHTRLAGAPTPVPHTDTSSDESDDFYWRLRKRAEKAGRTGNVVRAAILRTKAARVAPAALTATTRAEAEQDLQRLTTRLQAALLLSDTGAAEWLKDLPALLDKADQGDQGSRPVEARLLYDLQQVCLDHERDIYALDLVEYVLSAGKRPIKRPLPSQRLVRVIKHLRSAAQRLTMARVSDADRQHLGRLLQSSLNKCEERLRDRLRPVLTDALQDVGLTPRNPPERTAFLKVIEELLDRIVEHGFVTFGDLRDTLSRNQLKMPDLAEPQEFVRGDPLLRLDRRLATLLDGVYRPGEFYLRWLERFTALGFGTVNGRKLNRYFLFPFGAAFLLVFAFVHVVGWFTGQGHTPPAAVPKPAAAAAAPAATAPGPAEPGKKAEDGENPKRPAALDPDAANLEAGLEEIAETAARKSRFESLVFRSLLAPMEWLAVLGLGVFLLALINHEPLRQRCVWLAVRLGRLLQLVLIDLPGRLLRIEALQRIGASWSFQLFYWYLLKPLVVCAIVWPLFRGVITDVRVALPLLFLALNFLVNSRLGQAAGEAFVQTIGKLYEMLRSGFLSGLVRMVMHGFKRMVDFVEELLFSVDEWLRFRSGDSRFSMVVRAILGVFWYPVSFLARLYLVVLIEPTINPIKLPLSVLFAKIVYPLLIAGLPHEASLAEQLNYLAALGARPLAFLDPSWARALGWIIGMPTLWLLPDACTFLFWEMKENWRLYRANRPTNLRPVMIGQHGETMLQLLRPGFHSGTVPSLYARLRQAERDAGRTNNWRGARTWRRALQDVERTLQRFVSRELVTLLQQSPSWRGQSLSVGWVALASNRIRVELILADYPADSLWLEFEDRSGWLVAGVREAGWTAQLTPEQGQAATTALAGLYKLAGVDLVREQVRANLPPAATRYDVVNWDLVIWRDRKPPEALAYDLGTRRDQLRPRPLGSRRAVDGPILDARAVLFAAVPLTWERWVEAWQRDQQGLGPPRPFGPAVQLLPLSAPQQFPKVKADDRIQVAPGGPAHGLDGQIRAIDPRPPEPGHRNADEGIQQPPVPPPPVRPAADDERPNGPVPPSLGRELGNGKHEGAEP
jgi:hypothetical protein